MASRPQRERWKKTSNPCVVEAKAPDTLGGGRFRLQLRYTRRKGDKAVKRMSKRFQTREEALAAAPGMREDWEDGRGKPMDPSKPCLYWLQQRVFVLHAQLGRPPGRERIMKVV